MASSSLHISPQPPEEVSGDVLVIGVRALDAGASLAVEGEAFEGLAESLRLLAFTGSRDEFVRVPPVAGITARSIALVGLGSGPVAPSALRYAAGTAARLLTGVESLVFALPAKDDEEILAVLEGAAMGAYAFTGYRSTSLETTKLPASEITVLGDAVDPAALILRATVVSAAVSRVRDLVNTPPSDLYPESFAQEAVTAASGRSVQVTVLDDEQLLAQGFGGLVGVGRGSARGPRMVKLEYTPENAARHVALVGKGITFDTGGLSLKPPASMVGMKYDMTGAATVMEVLFAAEQLALPIRLTAWLCLAENMPSGTATRPNDVLTIKGGTTVEVLNTDAEGRLVLADGLVAASEEKPDIIIDVATLTGAATVALGTRYVAAMGDEELVNQMVEVAGRAGEPFWSMPLPDELRATLSSDVADIANARIGNSAAGMLLAGVFLREFVGTSDESGTKIPWVHLDIAGSAQNTGSGYGYVGKGPTGVAVRALIAMAEELSRA